MTLFHSGQSLYNGRHFQTGIYQFQSDSQFQSVALIILCHELLTEHCRLQTWQRCQNLTAACPLLCVQSTAVLSCTGVSQRTLLLLGLCFLHGWGFQPSESPICLQAGVCNESLGARILSMLFCLKSGWGNFQNNYPILKTKSNKWVSKEL